MKDSQLADGWQKGFERHLLQVCGNFTGLWTAFINPQSVWDNSKNAPKFDHVYQKCPNFGHNTKNAQCLSKIPKMPIACGTHKRPEISWANGADDRGHTLHGHKSDPTNGELNVCVCCLPVPEKHTKQHRRRCTPLRQDFEREGDDEERSDQV